MRPLKICLTGGPCAGKTSITELVRRQFSRELEVIPESASLLYRGGFPRARTGEEMKLVQTAIYHVQLAVESLSSNEFVEKTKLGLRGYLCDRGTVDSAAYWPGGTDGFYSTLGTSRATEFGRYDHVIHMESATEGLGYANAGALRTETPTEALALDRRIQDAWHGHPQLTVIASRNSFIEKVDEVVAVLQRLLAGTT